MSTRNSKKLNDSNLIIFLIFSVVMSFFFYFLWYRKHSAIVYFTSYFYWLFIDIIYYICPIEYINNVRIELIQLAKFNSVAPFSVWWDVMNKVGKFFIIIPVFLTIYSYKKLTKHPLNKIKRIINIETLPKIMAEFCSSIIPILHYGDKKTLLLNDNSEEHQSGLCPYDFSIKNNLIKDKFFDRERCRKVLSNQLGKKITSINELTKIESVMFTVFSSRIFGDYDLNESLEICEILNKSCNNGLHNGKKGYPILSSVDKFYKKYVKKHNQEINELISIYEYPRVLLYALHKKAILKGKLPSSFFRWLKGIDRELFYVLNTTGRKTPWSESAGVFNHYLWVEFSQKYKTEINGVMVEEAIDGIELYLLDNRYIEKDKK